MSVRFAVRLTVPGLEAFALASACRSIVSDATNHTRAVRPRKTGRKAGLVQVTGRNEGGRTGYSPAGIRDWSQTAFARGGRRRSLRHSKQFRLTEEVIRDHLLGRQTIGVYPLLLDDTCWFVAVDFDKKGLGSRRHSFL